MMRSTRPQAATIEIAIIASRDRGVQPAGSSQESKYLKNKPQLVCAAGSAWNLLAGAKNKGP